MVASYDIKYKDIEYTITIFKSADHYFYEIECGFIFTSSDEEDSHRVVYETPLDATFAAIRDICEGEESVVKKLIREIKLEEILP
jgi:hypothetical protein